MLYNAQLGHLLFKHKPVTVNGEPVLKHNLWNFRYEFDGMMHNTKVHDFVLPYNEETKEEFEVVLDFNEFEKQPWSDYFETFDKNDVFVENQDVQTGIKLTRMTFAWVRKSALPQTTPYLRKAYEDMLYRERQFKQAQAAFERAKAKFDESTLPSGTTLEEYLSNSTEN